MAEPEHTITLTPVCTLRSHTSDITGIDFAGRSLLATSSSDKSIRVYKWQVGDSFVEIGYSPLRGHRYHINCINFSPFGTKLASASTDGSSRIWDVKNGDCLCVLQPSSEAAMRVCAFSPNSALLATGGDDDMVGVWDVSTLSLLRHKTFPDLCLSRQVEGHESTVTTVGFSPDSCYLATGCSGGELRLYDAQYGHALPLGIRAEAHDLGVASLHFNPVLGKDEQSALTKKQYQLATGGQDTSLHLWVVEVGGTVAGAEAASFSVHHTMAGHSAPIMCVRFSCSGLLLASASGDKTVRLWDPMKMTPLSVLEGHKRYVTCCAFSDDGALLAAGSGDRTVYVWQVEPATRTVARLDSSAAGVRRMFARFPAMRFRENKKVVEWTCDDTCDWLVDQGLAEYSHNFRSHAIDGRELLLLTDEDLELKLGVDALGHRNRITRLIRKHSNSQKLPQLPGGPPVEYLCPITQELMNDPVICADGFTYERIAMEAWLAAGRRTSPMTNEKLLHISLTPNRTLRNLIIRYVEEQC